MAETRRKDVTGFPKINCQVTPQAFSTLNEIAGDRGMGAAIDELCTIADALASLSSITIEQLAERLKKIAK